MVVPVLCVCVHVTSVFIKCIQKENPCVGGQQHKDFLSGYMFEKIFSIVSIMSCLMSYITLISLITIATPDLFNERLYAMKQYDPNLL